MIKKKITIILILLLNLEFIMAKDSEKNTAKPLRFYALNYSNDVWQKTDRYLTQSLSFEYCNPLLSNALFGKLLIKSKDKQLFESGIKIIQNVYTPTSIKFEEVQKNNQPYSATFTFTQYHKEINFNKLYIFNSEIQLGILGPNAGGKQMQIGVHKAIGDNLPKGWDNQLANAPIINYNLQYAKPLLSKKYVELLPYSTLRVGTLNYDLSAGASISIGNKPSAFKFIPNKFEYSFSFNSEVKQVFYNAVLQGSYFKKSTYRLLPTEIQNIVFQNDLKYTMRYHNFKFSIAQTWLSKQYKKGLNHTYNSVCFGVFF